MDVIEMVAETGDKEREHQVDFSSVDEAISYAAQIEEGGGERDADPEEEADIAGEEADEGEGREGGGGGGGGG
jgi:hypothetical protein